MSTMQDSAGNQIPTRYIQKIDRERDKLVRRLFAKAEKLSAALTAFRAECLAEVARFQEHAATAYGVPLGGEKNGLMLSSFDGTLRVERRACDTLAFDDRLNAAQQLLDEWIRENTSGVNPDLLKLVNRAFRNTRNSGLRFGEVMRLTQLDIKDAKWKQAMDLIRASITVQSSRTHCRFYKRPDVRGDWKMVPLDIAQVKEPEVQP